MSTWKQFADKFNHLGMYSCIVCPFIKDKERQKRKRKHAGKDLLKYLDVKIIICFGNIKPYRNIPIYNLL